MRKVIFYLLIVSMIFSFFACDKAKGYKTKSGLILYTYSDFDADSLTKAGSILKLRYTKKVNDSIVEDNRYSMPAYETVMPPFAYPHEAGEVYAMFHKGDSIVLIQSADSLLKKALFYSIPDYIKKGDIITTNYKVLDVFPNDSIAKIDQNQEFENVMTLNRKTGPSRISNYLKTHNIDATMSPDTIFIETIQTGTGVKIDSNDMISLKFKASTFGGDSIIDNLDTASTVTEYLVGSGRMLQGVDEGLMTLKKGAHARLYVPAMKAFGASAPPGSDKGFQDLIFEVIIMDDDSLTTE